MFHGKSTPLPRAGDVMKQFGKRSFADHDKDKRPDGASEKRSWSSGWWILPAAALGCVAWVFIIKAVWDFLF